MLREPKWVHEIPKSIKNETKMDEKMKDKEIFPKVEEEKISKLRQTQGSTFSQCSQSKTNFICLQRNRTPYG